MRLTVERVSNGCIIRDHDERETVVVAADDPLEAARQMLVEVNDRAGAWRGDSGAEQPVVAVEPDRLPQHPEGCEHRHIAHWAYDGRKGWQCRCGISFVPRPAEPGA